MITAILKDKVLPPGMDFDNLRMEGLARLQQLTSDNWTDFNEHDPGVTILEQLCYAITDIAYRANYPIEDLLFETQQTSGDDGQCFFAPTDILTINPVTLKDYCKAILYDHPKIVKNAWATVLQNKLLVSLELYHNPITNAKAKLQQSLCKYHSWGEGEIEVAILQQVKISISAGLYLNKSYDAERTVAELLNAICAYISPQVKRYAVNELLEDQDINDFLQGPLPKNGIILNSGLSDRPMLITSHQIFQLIMSVSGIQSVTQIVINTDGAPSPTQELTLATGTIGSLDTEQCLNSLKVFINDSSYSLNKQEVLNLYNQANTVKIIYKNPGYDDDLITPSGKNRDISNYFSIQRGFPAVYGIGANGLPSNATDLRRSQANQLKAYLLGFEQIMANSLSKLSKAWCLFQISPTAQAGYGAGNYTQPIYNVPGVGQIIKDYVNNYDLEQPPLDWGKFQKNSGNSYEAKLKSYGRELDTPKRKSLFLDHLLARFGQDPKNYQAPSKPAIDSHLQNNIIKSNTLYYYNKISAERANTGADKNAILGSGLKIQLCILLGIDISIHQNTFLILENETITDYENGPLIKIAPQQLSFVFNYEAATFTIEFKDFLTRQIYLLTPAHLQPVIYWYDLPNFMYLKTHCNHDDAL